MPTGINGLSRQTSDDCTPSLIMNNSQSSNECFAAKKHSYAYAVLKLFEYACFVEAVQVVGTVRPSIICLCLQQRWLGEIDYMIYFTQSRLLLERVYWVIVLILWSCVIDGEFSAWKVLCRNKNPFRKTFFFCLFTSKETEGNVHWFQTGKNTTIRRASVQEPCVSRHQGAPLEGSPWNMTALRYSGEPQIGPSLPVSRTSNVSFPVIIQ